MNRQQKCGNCRVEMLELLGCVMTCTGTFRAFREPDGQHAGAS